MKRFNNVKEKQVVCSWQREYFNWPCANKGESTLTPSWPDPLSTSLHLCTLSLPLLSKRHQKCEEHQCISSYLSRCFHRGIFPAHSQGEWHNDSATSPQKNAL